MSIGVASHQKILTLASRKYGTHFASREDPSRDSGHRPQNTGRSGKYGTVGNPSHSQWHSVVCINDVIAT